MPLKTTLFCSTLLCVAFPVLAEEKRELGAHEHGHGALNIAVEGRSLLMELEVPGHDIVGFEHAAVSDADKAAVETGLAQLAKAGELFGLPAAAGCELVEVSAEVHGDEDHEAHEDHDHDAHKDDHDHDDHKGDHEAHEEEEGHSEFHAEYAFTCQKADNLTEIELTYFNVFPNAEELDVQVVTDAGALKVEASAEAATVALK